MRGSTVGSYRITDLLGEGGMGAVYAAEHTRLGRKAAVKVLLDELSHNKEVVARFFNEAKAATAIDHPGIVSVFDFGYDTAGRAYIVMEFLEGETLGDRRRRLGRLPVGESLTLCRQVAGALGAAHARGIVHRDLKPDNIMLVRDPDVLGGLRAKVLDFGIAKLVDLGERQSDTLPSVNTKTGRIMGTPAYMAPEQCRGAGEVDARADMYALGCVLYALCCGRPPFVAEASGDLIAAHILTAPPAPRTIEPDIPPAVEEVLLRLLAKRPEDRYASMAEVVQALEAASAGELPPGLGLRRSAVLPSVPADLVPTVDDKPNEKGRATPPPASGETKATGLGPAERRAEVTRPTTLGAAAHQSQAPAPPGRSRVRPLVGLVAIAALAGGAAIWRTRAHVEPASPGPQATIAALAALAPVPEPPPPAEVRLAITSEPAGADVLDADDGKRLGETPFTRSFPRRAGEIRFVVRRRGYLKESIAMDGTRNGERHLTLRVPERKRHADAETAKSTSPVVPAGRHADKPIEDGAIDPYSP